MTPLGVWLLARLAVHDHYNRGLRVGRQEVIFGLGLNDVDRLEVARISLVLAEVRGAARHPVRRRPG